MRTNIQLESGDADYAWSRIAHIDRPERSQWEEMVGVWKARAEWINEANLEAEDDEPSANGGHKNGTPIENLSIEATKNGRSQSKRRTEKLVVGWGDSVWILSVKSESKSTGKEPGRRTAGSATIIHQ
jgi:vacuolar protein sorting-associated protein 41